ncbi:TetR/AcrR family transcriptional regulator [Streptomyces xanthochromogenes]|uniref:TetR/AcrR family transcriptional regulator n=1 Tax=Streptomyces xanthochromogenes TaxID=67384 RepID=UPI00342354E7
MTKQYRSLCTRQDLIRSAAEVIDRSGFAESSIVTISSGAGVSTGGLHFHFKNKQVLGEAVELAAAQALLFITGGVPLRHPAPVQLLIDASHALVRGLAADPVLRAGFGLGRDATWQGVVNLWEQWQDWIQLVLTVARDQGSLAPEVALEGPVSAITAVVAGLEVLGGKDEAWRSCRVITQFWQLLLPGLVTEAVLGGLIPEGSPAMPGAADVSWAPETRVQQVCGVA